MLRYLFGGSPAEDITKQTGAEGSVNTAADGTSQEQLGGGLIVPEKEAITVPITSSAPAEKAEDPAAAPNTENHETWDNLMQDKPADATPSDDGGEAGTFLEQMIARESTPGAATEAEKVMIGEDLLHKPDDPGSQSNWEKENVKDTLPAMKEEPHLPEIEEPTFSVEVEKPQKVETIADQAQALLEAQRGVRDQAKAYHDMLQIQADDARRFKEKAEKELKDATAKEGALAADIEHARQALDASEKTVDFYAKMLEEARHTLGQNVEGTSGQQV